VSGKGGIDTITTILQLVYVAFMGSEFLRRKT